MFYEIKALDSLFFRDAAPFSVATDVYAKSLFPPLPSVYYGALRTVYFAHNIEAFSEANEDTDVTLKMQIGMSALKRKEEWLFPKPLDTELSEVIQGEQEIYCFKTLALEKIEDISSYPLPLIVRSSKYKKTKDIQGEVLFNHITLEKYLNGEVSDLKGILLNDLITVERKVGIKVNRKTGKSQDEMFYQTESIQLENKNNGRVSIVLEITEIELPEKSLVKLGGRSKAGYLEKISSKIDFSLDEKKDEMEYFKLYFATPAYFNKGWYPDWIKAQDNSFIGEYEREGKKIKCELVAATVGRHIGAGGYDMKKNSPKKMKYDIPAGSVYYFKLKEGSFEDVKFLFHMKNINDDPSDSNQGFGYCLVGKVKGEK